MTAALRPVGPSGQRPWPRRADRTAATRGGAFCRCDLVCPIVAGSQQILRSGAACGCRLVAMCDLSPERDEVATLVARALPYTPLCAVLGLVLGWIPLFIHGPHPWKFTMWRLNGAIAVWGFYTARMLIGLLVGITHWPG